MNNKNELFILLDFNASRKYSHHWSYLNSYKLLLKSQGKSFEIWLPKNSDAEVLNELNENYFTILRSNVYGYARNENISQWVVDSVINIFMIKIVSKFNLKIAEYFRGKFAFFYYRKAYKRIIKIKNNGIKVHLICPTTDSLAIRFLEKCLNNKMIFACISLRLTGLKHKDNFKIFDTENRIAILTKKFKQSKILIGYETEPYKNYLIEIGMNIDDLRWAPIPSNETSCVRQSSLDVINLGFLGTARPNKGFSDIPNLLNSLVLNGIKFKATVQKAVYPWALYEKTIAELMNFGEYVNIIPENISSEELYHEIVASDLLVLPYFIENYKIAGSGLLFTAADLHIPVLTKKGIAFEWDIDQYKLGFIYDNLDQFISVIKHLKTGYANFGFDKYNKSRNKAILSFIGIIK
jgi:hypothetical protein